MRHASSTSRTANARCPAPAEHHAAPAANAGADHAPDFWFERSQAYAAAGDFAREVLASVPEDRASGTMLRHSAIALAGTVASAVSTVRERLPEATLSAHDYAQSVAGLLILHADLSTMTPGQQAKLREPISAVARLLFGLRRAIIQSPS